MDYNRIMDALMRLIELVRPYSWIITPIISFIIGQLLRKAYTKWRSPNAKAERPEKRTSVEIITRPLPPTGTPTAQQIEAHRRLSNRDKWAGRVLAFLGVLMCAFALLDLILFGLLILSQPFSYQSYAQFGNLLLGVYFLWQYAKRKQRQRAESHAAAQLQPAPPADQLTAGSGLDSSFVQEGWKVRAKKRELRDKCVETFEAIGAKVKHHDIAPERSGYVQAQLGNDLMEAHFEQVKRKEFVMRVESRPEGGASPNSRARQLSNVNKFYEEF